MQTPSGDDPTDLLAPVPALRTGALQVRHARDLLTRPGNTVTSIAKLLGVSRKTIYKYVPELKGGRVALAEATAAAELPRPAKSAE